MIWVGAVVAGYLCWAIPYYVHLTMHPPEEKETE